MSTSDAAAGRAARPAERFVDGPFLKRLVIACATVPGVLLLWDAYRGQLGVNEVNFAIRTTGLVGLVFLVASLAITPLRKLTGWNVLIAVRRNLGVYGFFYIAAHFAIFFVLDRDASVSSTFDEIVQRQYLWFGFGALVLMIPLAATSFDGMVSRLGAKRWKRLHRLAYAAVIGGVVHYYLLVKADTTKPLVFGGIVGALLLARAIPSKKKPRRFWKGELRVARVVDETHDVKTFRLVMPGGGKLPFEHAAGQYLNLTLTIDGKPVRRSYTIASSPASRDHCEVSIKRVADGYASHHMHDAVTEGSLLSVSAPAGRFVFDGATARRIVMIAGGVGITPMMSVIRWLTDRSWSGEIYLLFSVREARDVVFADEIAALRSRFPNLKVKIVVSSEVGHVTRATIDDFVPGLARGPVMLCGPAPMMAAMRRILVDEIGVPDGDVLEEAFVSPGAAGADTTSPAAAEARTVQFRRTGTIADSVGLTVLEAAEEAGVALPYECRSGICGQCKTRLVSGRVTMDVQDALTAGDRAGGVILACQARAVGDVIVDA
jgi:ferredoxin-NADP reductase/DMSO/TMAO reductase YedYZ heme-binding membrane subunit